jgi:hypothetical protein
MSAMNVNDALSYLFVTLCVYLLIVTVEKRLSPVSLTALSCALTVALFTKYTAFVVLPMTVSVFAAVAWGRSVAVKKAVIALLLVLLLPVAALSGYFLSNLKGSGNPLPWNTQIYDPVAHRPVDADPIDFITFKPWEDLATPMLAPGKLHSFWTLIYSGTWFDTEPLFQPFLDKETAWWEHYFRWYRGEDGYPGNNPAMPGFASLTGSALIALGIFPFGLMLAGGYFAFSRRGEGCGSSAGICIVMFPLLVLLNTAGIIAMTLKLPVYCSMKPSYFLNSMSAFALFQAIGINRFERVTGFKKLVSAIFGILFCLVGVHILQIVIARLTSL